MACGTTMSPIVYSTGYTAQTNLHFNENSNRKQATTAEGNLRWAIAYPKAFKWKRL